MPQITTIKQKRNQTQETYCKTENQNKRKTHTKQAHEQNTQKTNKPEGNKQKGNKNFVNERIKAQGKTNKKST